MVMDKLLSLSDRAYMIDQLPWYTVEELMEQGIWDLPLPHTRKTTVDEDGTVI